MNGFGEDRFGNGEGNPERDRLPRRPLLNAGAQLGGGLEAVTLNASLGTIAALVILTAYYPPRILRERLGVTGIDVET